MDLKKFGFVDINHELLSRTDTPYRVYAELLEDEAQKQFYDVLRQPFVTYGALMPDAHTGSYRIYYAYRWSLCYQRYGSTSVCRV